MYDRYTPHPLHQLIPFLIILIGAVVLGIWPDTWQGWGVFVASIIIGIRTSLWIAWVGEKREQTDFWENLGYELEQLNKAKPEVWEMMGYIRPPETVQLKNEVTGEEDRSPYYEQVNTTFNISPSEMNLFANEVVSGKKTLAETEWVRTPIGSTKVRELKQQMMKVGLLKKAHPGASTQGFLLTEKGVEYLMRYASDWAKQMYGERGEKIPVAKNVLPRPPTD